MAWHAGLRAIIRRTTTDEEGAYTPAWQEKFTGVGWQTVLQLRPRMGRHRRAKTQGKCTIIIGSGINHWYHINLITVPARWR